jgi:hypothetical protein
MFNRRHQKFNDFSIIFVFYRFWSFLGHFWWNLAEWKKSTVRDFFDPIFDFLDRNLCYRNLSKNRPHKKHCAWARTPPPGEFIDFYRNLSKIMVLGAFNRAGKSVSKIGIYALPPSKSDFYAVFNNSRPNLVP